MCVTSPPYWGLRDYGVMGQIGLEATLQEWVDKMVAVFREVRRVLVPGGTLWLNLGDGYFGGGKAGKGGIQKWGGIESQNQNRKYGPPVAIPEGLKPKDMMGQPWRIAFALQADGWYLRSDIIWHKPNPMPESVRDRPTKAHEYLFLLAKGVTYFYDADAILESVTGNAHAQGSGIGKKVAVPGRGIRHNSSFGEATRNATVADLPMSRNRRTVWTIATQPFPEAHFATFPEALVEPCIRAGCPGGGIVLDPFMGSGTTALVAKKLNRHFLGIELNPAYIEIANRRLQTAVPLFMETAI